MAKFIDGKTFAAGMVYRQLASMDYDYVVGLDIGHGESMAYIYIMKEGKLEKLQFDFSGNPKMLSIISYKPNKIVLGIDAINEESFVKNFKVIPALWDTPSDSRGQETYGTLMKDFIKTFWEGIITYDKINGERLKQAIAEGKVLVVIGCPSDTTWTDEKAVKTYQNLVRKAIKCEHVMILPESTAAIMSAILENAGNTVVPHMGMAVIDAGSSTIDFTYVLLGKTILTRSLRVAGHELDKQMLEQAIDTSIKEPKCSMTEADRYEISEQQRPYLETKIREWKEQHYRHGNSLGNQSLAIWGKDENGNVNRDILAPFDLKFNVNEEFLLKALNKKDIMVDGKTESWLWHCEKFVDDCLALIPKGEQGQPLCDHLIMTGGTSYVKQFHDMVQEKCNAQGIKVVDSKNRDASVASGLCYAKSLEIRGKKLVENYQKTVAEHIKKGYGNFAKEYSRYLAEFVCQDMKEIISKWAQQTGGIGETLLIVDINKAVKKNSNITGGEGQEKVEQLLSTHFWNIQEGKTAADGTQSPGIRSEVNRVAQEIYKTQLNTAPQLPQMKQQQINQLVSQLQLHKMICKTISAVEQDAKGTLNYLFGVLMSAVGNIFSNGKSKHYSQNYLKKIHQQMNDSKKFKHMVDKTARKLETELLQPCTMQNKFTSYAEEQAEALLGMVLFLVYEEM